MADGSHDFGANQTRSDMYQMPASAEQGEQMWRRNFFHDVHIIIIIAT